MNIILKIFLYIIILILFGYISLCIFFSNYELIKIFYSLFIGCFFVYFLKNNFIKLFNIEIQKFLDFNFYTSLLTFIFLFPVIIKAPYLRYHLQNFSKLWNKNKIFYMGNKNTQKNIIESVIEISKMKIGALITIEKYNSLEQYAQKSILIDGIVSKELLINIFLPNSPLHDGAVIIRGDKILSAGAYFILSEKQNFTKTTGSRHRAALGISENSDSMSIIVSEETGKISIAFEGIILKMNDKNQIQEYLSMFMI
ncbi:diadenylate cyclase [Candidatus Phytoplasma oryzae]|nr:DNA integrity scanning protein DisA nucleotide-binding domain protein [Candidatus Phytoplasma oryzae]